MADPVAAVGNAEIFDPSKERKKKKKKVLDLDSMLVGGSSSAPAVEDDSAQDAGTGSAPADDGLGGELAGDAHDDILESLADFGGKKKKKKLKKVSEIDDAVVEELVGGGDEEALDFGKKKKKKVKGTIGLDDLVAGEEGASTPADDIVVVEDEQGGGLVERGDEVEGIADAEPSILVLDHDDESTNANNEIQFDDEDEDSATKENDEIVKAPAVKSWLSSDRDYTYDELLDRVFEIMRAKNPEMVSGTKQKFVMRPPQVVRIGTKKTSFVNFMEICKMLHRHQKHLLDFLLSELGTSGSIDGNNQLIIKGRFQQKQIENVLRRYIKEYVTCHTCRSPNTLLQKDFRLFFLQCEACGSRCSVASIKHGFQAQVSKRAAMRAKAN